LEVAKKILVVEDEESVRQAVFTILTSYGHKVTAVDDAPSGLEAFDKEGCFDIVFTDLSLPGRSGWELADDLKMKSPETPIVLLSGWDVRQDEVDAHGSISLVLSKPVKIKDMLQVIRDLAR